MKKINKKKIIILLLIMGLIILEIIALRSSSAENIIEMSATIVDNHGNLANVETILNAIDGDTSGYYILLPENIEGKIISRYIIENKSIISENEEEENIEAEETEDDIEQNNTENVESEEQSQDLTLQDDLENDNETATVSNEQNEIIANGIERLPGEKIYLTEEELENKSITLVVEYDTKTTESVILYNQTISQNIDDEKNISISGYMPNGAEIIIEELTYEDIEEPISDYINDSTYISVIYDIKISYDGQEYEPDEFDENVEVTISGIEEIDTQTQSYTVVHIDTDTNEADKIVNVTSKENEVVFEASEFSAYAIMVTSDEDSFAATTYSVELSNAATWDGSSVASGFDYGNGTKEEPYLISTAAELAYLATSVNSGTTYSGVYFQLTNDIDLADNAWTPIGTHANPFMGVFDGAGHMIANATIIISSYPTTTSTIESYGFFGSIGGSTTVETEIKNIEFTNITATITASGTMSSNNSGIHIGILCGTQYTNSQINNVIVKNSAVNNTNTFTVGSTVVQLFVGGLVGGQVYNSSSETNNDESHIIANCYVDVDISLSAGVGNQVARIIQYCTGGIVGCIRSTQVSWPLNCLYTGTISSNGMIGPIFAGLRNSTAASVTRNDLSGNADTIWQGNDAGNGTMTSYYSSFMAKTTTFTTTVTDGTSTARISTTTTNQGYIQGVNKGIYVSDKTTRLDAFNEYFDDDSYVTWYLDNDDFSFTARLTADVYEQPESYYNLIVTNEYATTNITYIYQWYINGELDNGTTGTTLYKEESWVTEYEVVAVVSDGTYYTIVRFTIPKMSLYFEFTLDEVTGTLTASLLGTAIDKGLCSESDFTYQWYISDISGMEDEKIEEATTLSITGLVQTTDYEIIATYIDDNSITVDGTYTYGDRIVIFCDYNNGNDNNDGYTPETAVKTLPTAYGKLYSTGDMSQNIIVLMGDYTTRDVYYNTKNSTNTNYQKAATITGIYKGTDYSGNLYMYYNSSTYNFINGDTTFQYLIFNGNNSQAYLYAQGHDLVMGKGLTMSNYSEANTNQGLITGSAPAFHVFGGYLQYNYSTLPRNNGSITIKSGVYGRVLGGGGSGTSSGAGQTTSHDFTGSNLTTDIYTATIYVDIEESTKGDYTYDINLLVGGATAGNMCADITVNVTSGSIGRLLGGSIGDRVNMGNNWNYPENTFIGYTTLNLEGGTIQELYGGSLGRNMDALSGSSSLVCDIYFYGIININISGGVVVNSNIYGAGAGGVTGYSENSTDTYKSYGQDIDTVVNINISGGTINGNIYGGGYGYTEYLTAATTATDGGSLYGDSNINITGGTITGNIYGAGCGEVVTGRTKLAQMEGKSTITISETPTITGEIYGGGMGISGYDDMATLTGTTEVNIDANLIDTSVVFGGGSYAKTEGDTAVNIISGTHNANIYGGGNLATVSGTATVTITGGTSGEVYGGGKLASVEISYVYLNGGTVKYIFGGGEAADVTKTNVYLQGGTATNIFGGSNTSGTVTESNVTTVSGTTDYIYGGNNAGGTTTESIVVISGGTINQTVYGGGKQADTGTVYLTVNATDNTVPKMFAGGQSASVTEGTYIDFYGGSVGEVFGGSDTTGDVPTSTIYIYGGTIGDLYGGNNAGGATTDTYIYVMQTSGSIERVYGGGNKATTTSSKVYLMQSVNKIGEAYGGGNEASVTTPYISLEGANVGKVFGGSNASGDVELTDVDIQSGTADEVYGGNNAGGTVTTTDVTITGGTIGDVYGGNNAGGTVGTTDVLVSGGTSSAVYGGNNLDGTSGDNDVVITEEGTVTDVYGGGNQAVAASANVKISGTIKRYVYGGGNIATVTGDVILDIENANISENVYGGGNEGVVQGSTYLYILDSILGKSVYAGGNGSTATVLGNTNLYMCGATNVGKHVFGGGNQATTGTNAGSEDIPSGSSESKVNIVGGIIGGNVYGGANTSRVYGITVTNIGYEAIVENLGITEIALGDETKGLTKGDIEITGTVFGGGEANESGSEDYDYDYISVSGGTTININAQDYDTFKILGSIFGSGNASRTIGMSYIYIENYGEVNSPKSNVSIQRATEVILINSAIALDGAKDKTNKYDGEYYSLSNIDNLKLKNESTLYLNCGTNLLKQFESVVDIDGEEVYATAEINEDTGETTVNVENRIYLLEGNNMNIALDESNTTYGEVHGMTYFGIYTGKNDPSGTTGFYESGLANGETIINLGTFSSNAYIQGLHMKDPEHDITVNGFYTNYNEDGIIKKGYVGVTPPEDLFYIWIVGEDLDVTRFEFSLTASKFATLGTYELSLVGFGTANTKMSLLSVSTDLNDGITLIDAGSIDAVAGDEDTANSTFGLTMKNGNANWQTNSSTTILSEEAKRYSGSVTYNKDNTSYTPSLLFCLYHSENITIEQELGIVTIRFQVLTPISDLSYKISYIDIIITMDTALYQDDYYEAAMTPGEEFELFTSTATNITSTSTLSAYYSLYISDFSDSQYYEDYTTYKRYLTSRDSESRARVFKEGTSITMIDLVTNQYYTYVVTAEDEESGKYLYSFDDFVSMGTEGLLYNQDEAIKQYKDDDKNLIYENFIFHVNFENSGIEEDQIDNTLLMELRDSTGQEIMISVLGSARSKVTYGIYTNQDADIAVSLSTDQETIYLGDSFQLNVTTDFSQQIISSKTVYDTNYFDEKMGIKISIYDNEGNLLSLDSLLGITFTLDDISYYPRIDGTTRIKIADKIANILARLTVDTSNNTTLATGTYTIKVESFGSSDGIYYGLEPSDSAEITIRVINSAYGLKATTEDVDKIVDKDTGISQGEDNEITASVEYSSAFDTPSIRVKLYRRNYDSVYALNYELVDLADYVTNSLATTSGDKEYLVSAEPKEGETISYTINLKENLTSGTYRLTFALYDGDTYITEVYDYIIIK